jgi:SAM-dependent methyltransferase
MKKINIGAGRTHIPGFINVDIASHADVQIDLNKEALPFEDNSVDLVFSYHTLEHLDNYLFALSEIHRVLKHNGIFLLGVPYVTLTKFNLVNPYHKQHFNEHSFRFFGNLKGSAIEENQIVFHSIYYKLFYMGTFKFLPPPFKTWCKNHLFNVVKKIEYGMVAVKTNDPVLTKSASELKKMYKQIAKARQPYKLPTTKEQAGTAEKLLKTLKYWWNGEI